MAFGLLRYKPAYYAKDFVFFFLKENNSNLSRKVWLAFSFTSLNKKERKSRRVRKYRPKKWLVFSWIIAEYNTIPTRFFGVLQFANW